jgi:hypothetical protein
MMHPLIAAIVSALALVGNTALWIGILNRSHGLGIWRPLIHACTAISLAALVLGPVAIAASFPLLALDAERLLPDGLARCAEIVQGRGSPFLLLYATLCSIYAVTASIATLAWRSRR